MAATVTTPPPTGRPFRSAPAAAMGGGSRPPHRRWARRHLEQPSLSPPPARPPPLPTRPPPPLAPPPGHPRPLGSRSAAVTVQTAMATLVVATQAAVAAPPPPPLPPFRAPRQCPMPAALACGAVASAAMPGFGQTPLATGTRAALCRVRGGDPPTTGPPSLPLVLGRSAPSWPASALIQRRVGPPAGPARGHCAEAARPVRPLVAP